MKMKENGEKEKQIAISKGHIKDGIPYISVIGDGGWNKRSYGHGMSSTAGVVSFVYTVFINNMNV